MLHKEAKVKVDKWDINYLKVGKGPHKVLCLPGALGTIWTDFKPQIEGFDLEKFTLVVWDPPGYGKSRPPEKDFPADFYEKDADYAYEFMKIRDITSWSEKMREPFVEIYGKQFLAVYWSKWLDGMITVFNSDKGNICAQMLKDIKCPTFILYGERDPL
ncbi:Bphl-like protein, partial [Operophtera brumata]